MVFTTNVLVVYFFIFLHLITSTTLDDLNMDWLFSPSNTISRKSSVSNLIPKEGCGEVVPLDRIVRGNKTQLLEYPWMAHLWIDGDMGSTPCGGSLINNRYVITAAHCVNFALSVYVRLGEYDTESEIDCLPGDKTKCAPEIQRFTINDIKKDVIMHKEYTKGHNDIALLRLPRSADLTAINVKPICLPTNDVAVNVDGKLLVASGWGVTDTKERSNILLDVTLMGMPNKACKASYYTWVTRKHICAIGENGKDSCNGDSGGPLQRRTNFNGAVRQVLFGIVSIGTKDCGTGWPGVYTRVSSYLQWIFKNIKP